MRKSMVLMSSVFLTLIFQLPFTHAKQPSEAKGLELFGTQLQGATRSELRTTLQKAGLQVVREDNRYWVDEYNASSVLDGASIFHVGYVAETGIFAYAEYTFKAFMDKGLVTKVANMVSTKYGAPNNKSGNPQLGNVSYKWNFPSGMSVEVSRGWPDTTTYLTYIDKSAKAKMDAEITAEKKRQENEKAQSQSNAF